MSIYLDHAATTPMSEEVLDKMYHIMKENFGNPSSTHEYGRKGKRELLLARKIIADSLGAKPHEIIFTSGGTESDNTAIIQTALSRKNLGKHIITTKVEHPAVLEPMKYLASLGFEITYLPVDEKGRLSLKTFKDNLRDDTILVSIMMVNNETGTIFPIKEIGDILKDHQAVFHTDAVQAYGPLEINLGDLGVDLLSVSAHKFNGPKGVGFLYEREGIVLPPFIKGGEQEEKRRAGTENLPGIVGMAEAVKAFSHRKAGQKKMKELSDYILNRLTAEKIAFALNGDIENKIPQTMNLYFPHIHRDILLTRLDLLGIALSAGSACTAGIAEPSHVLSAMFGKEAPQVKASLRISLGYENTLEEMALFCDKLIAELKR